MTQAAMRAAVVAGIETRQEAARAAGMRGEPFAECSWREAVGSVKTPSYSARTWRLESVGCRRQQQSQRALLPQSRTRSRWAELRRGASFGCASWPRGHLPERVAPGASKPPSDPVEPGASSSRSRLPPSSPPSPTPAPPSPSLPPPSPPPRCSQRVSRFPPHGSRRPPPWQQSVLL